jgi:hypothetical protein
MGNYGERKPSLGELASSKAFSQQDNPDNNTQQTGKQMSKQMMETVIFL